MKNTTALLKFVNDEQFFEVLIKFETRKVEACKLLQAYMFDRWQITIFEAMGILQNVQKEWK